MDTFTQAYIECALWSSMDNANEQGGEPLDANYTVDDIASGTLEQMISDCFDFQQEHAADLAGMDAAQAGRDFWLTRNRHGAGFWDRGLGVLGTRLTDAAHAYGGFDLYVGDDGFIYGS